MFILALVLAFVLSGCVETGGGAMSTKPATMAKAETAAQSFHKLACASYPPSSSPWHVKNLYDCKTRELFVPYQLWTGADWDGRKDGPCMHKVDNSFTVNDRSETRIWGPKKWSNLESGEDEIVWVREKLNSDKVQYFTCHEQGIGRVYDSRGPRYWYTGRCKFPAGKGWQIGGIQGCQNTEIEITHVGLDGNGRLSELEFKYFTRGRLDHIYRYVPNQGMTNAWKQ